MGRPERRAAVRAVHLPRLRPVIVAPVVVDMVAGIADRVRREETAMIGRRERR
jgi:hypothetical protein